jgi:hypothetical protein
MMFEQTTSIDLLNLPPAFSLLSGHDIHRFYKKIGS